MKRGVGPVFLLLVLIGCFPNLRAEPLCQAPRSLVQKPDTVHAFLVEAFRCRDYADAHQVLSRATRERLPYELFYSLFASHEAFRGLILKSEQHGAPVTTEAGTRVRVCNPDYGFTEEFELRHEYGGRMWTLEITEEQQERLRALALEWLEFQYRAAGDYYVVMPDQETARVWSRCSCPISR